MRTWAALLIAITGCGVGSCGAGGTDGKPEPSVLAAETDGLVPGRSTEAEVTRAWRGAKVARDRAFGGDGMVAHDGHPAIQLELGQRRAWLIELDGAPRLVALGLPLARACTVAVPALVPRQRYGPCGNRLADPNEYARCTRTTDGARKLEVSCRDGDALRYRVMIAAGRYGL